MKLSATQENLAHALSMVGPIAAKGGTLPILQNILLEAREGSLKLSATNLEIGVVAHVRGKVEQEGTFTANGRLLSEYVNLLPRETITLSLDQDHLAVHAGNQQTKIHGLGAEEFPVIPSIDGGQTITLDGSLFREAIGQVLFSVSMSDSRPEISGVLLYISGESVTLVGTDSYRLAEKTVALKAKAQHDASVIVPLRTMQELARIIGHAEGEVAITISKNQILFAVEDVELISRVIVGNFPDYKQIIPTGSKTEVVLDAEPLSRAIKSASLFCRQGLNHVTFQFSSDRILVSASASQVGENMVDVPAKVQGRDVDIVFDYRFVLDGLSVIDSSEVVIKLDGGASPGLFVPKDDATYRYLVMPIKQ